MRDRSLLLSSVLSLAVFLIIWVSVFVTAELSGADSQLSLWVYNLNPGAFVTNLLAAAAVYGREYFWGGILLLMLAFGGKETRVLAVELGVLFVVGIAAGEVLKSTIYRPRPPLSISGIVPRIPLDSDSSFPSGHALVVSIGAAFSLVTFRKRWLAALLTVEAVVVCFARVFVGVHYPTDVVAGAAIGVSIALAGLVAERRYLEKPLTKLFGREKGEGTLKEKSAAAG